MHAYAAPRRAGALLVAGVVLACLLAAAGVVAVAGWPGADRQRPPSPIPERALVAPRAEVRAAALLEAWDVRRARVWESGRADDLGALYEPGSRAGRRDSTMLAAWRARGLRVEGLRTQVLGLRVVAHRPGRFDLEVVDRVVAGTAVGAGLRRPLPRDGPTTRRVVLVDSPAGWQVGSVSAARRPARP